MPERAFQQIDVFSQRPGDGNPLAVVLDAQGLSDADMQRFATWANLSETTYLLPPTEAGLAAGADYRVRIFSPGGELSFAGHPTLGSCHAWLKAGGSPRVPGSIVQECAGGLVRIEQSDGLLAFAAPPMQRSAPNPALLALVTGALGLRPHAPTPLSAGRRIHPRALPWQPAGRGAGRQGLTAEAMQQFTDWTHLSEATFVLPPTPEGRAAGADYRVRIFCPGRELPFAGHPTLGSCHAWLQSGGQPQWRAAWCRNAAWAWSRCARTMTAWPLRPHR
jgi:predicted PhzF superfamily epimerase YddE/YHI9